MSETHLLTRNDGSWDTRTLQNKSEESNSSIANHNNHDKNNINETKKINSDKNLEFTVPNSNNNHLSSKQIRKLVRMKHSHRIVDNAQNNNTNNNTNNNNNNNNDTNNDTNTHHTSYDISSTNNNSQQMSTSNNNGSNLDDIFAIFGAPANNLNSIPTQKLPQIQQITSVIPTGQNNNNNPFYDENTSFFDDFLSINNNGNESNNNTQKKTNTEKNESDSSTGSDTGKDKETRNEAEENEGEQDDETEDDNETENDKENTDYKTVNNKKRHTAPVGDVSKAVNQLEKEKTIPEREKGVNLRSSGVGQRIDEETTQSTTNPSPPAPNKLFDALPELKRGTSLLKYGHYGYPHFRQFNLSEDNSKLVWFSTSKTMDKTSIDIKDITEVITGQHTKEFRRFEWNKLAPASFSIIYDHGTKALNLVAKSIDEMKFWVEALRKLRELARKGENLQQISKLEIPIEFHDRNRPQSRKTSGTTTVKNDTIKKPIDPFMKQVLFNELASLKKLYEEVALESLNSIARASSEYPSIQRTLSELEERIEELNDEVSHSGNAKLVENGIWRTKVDAETLKDKIRVVIKENKGNHDSLKRRWSIF